MTDPTLSRKKLIVLFSAIFVAVSLPLFFLLYNSYKEFQTQYKFTSSELRGIELIDSFLNEFEKVPVSAPETIDLKKEFYRKKIITENSLSLDEGSLREFKETLDLELPRFREVYSEKYYSPLIRSMANKSNLVLDPDLDSYYLIDIVALKTPTILRILSNDSEFENMAQSLKNIDDILLEIQYSLETSRVHAKQKGKILNYTLLIDILNKFEKEIHSQINGKKKYNFKILLEHASFMRVEAMLLLQNMLIDRNLSLKDKSTKILQFTLIFWLSGILILTYLVSQFMIVQHTALKRILKQKKALDSSTLICETDICGKINYINSQMCTLTGYAQEELIGRSHSVINSGFHPESFWETFWATIKSGKTWRGEICNKAKDGSFIWCETVVIPEFNEKGMIVSYNSISVDITAKKDNQMKMEHSQKLASIGEIAAGVGHEINNPLMISSGSLHSLKKQLKANNFFENARTSIQKIEAANERIKIIVNGLRTYSRSDGNELKEICVNDAVTQTLFLVSDIYKKEGISFDLQLPDCNYFILGNLGKLQQIVMNMLSNARDALSNANTKIITIKIEQNSKNQILLTIADTGEGIPPHIIDKIFKPFFTTKEAGKGTGIGLGLVSDFVRLMNGEIDVQSQLGHGTSFVLSFPGHISQPTEEKKEEVSHIKMFKRALIVDDEADIREILGEYLKENGMQIEEASSAEEALAQLSDNQYDYIFTDLKMHSMNGDEFILHAYSTYDLKQTEIFLFSGADESAVKNIDNIPHGFIAKPFNKEEIYQILYHKVQQTTKKTA